MERELCILVAPREERADRPPMDRIDIWIPLLVGGGAIAFTMLIHGAAVLATLHFVRRARTRGRFGLGFWRDMSIFAVGLGIQLLAHLAGIGAWALLFILCGEFQTTGLAIYHSAMNYTTLGYGDVVMSPAWRVLGPIEATAGLLMFGVSTGILVALIERLAMGRFPDLRD
jgi:hypothetical protein